jgi:hypothetical protein
MDSQLAHHGDLDTEFLTRVLLDLSATGPETDVLDWFAVRTVDELGFTNAWIRSRRVVALGIFYSGGAVAGTVEHAITRTRVLAGSAPRRWSAYHPGATLPMSTFTALQRAISATVGLALGLEATGAYELARALDEASTMCEAFSPEEFEAATVLVKGWVASASDMAMAVHNITTPH